MNTEERLNPQQWAEITYGRVQVHDLRRTRRAVKAASAMVGDVWASLPKQQYTWKDVKALYRLLDESAVTCEKLMQPHYQLTRAQIDAQSVVLLVQDATEIDLSPQTKMSGIGQIGNAKGRGTLLQYAAADPQVCWCMEVIRVADLFPFFRACLWTQTHFVVRAAQNRRVQAEEEEIAHLLDRVRGFAGQDQRPFEVPASHGRQGRQTALQISFGPLTLLPPWNDPRGSKEPLTLWAVLVWEEEAPEGEEALEWILLTSAATHTQEQAWERVSWYRCRWRAQDYLKSPQDRRSHRRATAASAPIA